MTTSAHTIRHEEVLNTEHLQGAETEDDPASKRLREHAEAVGAIPPSTLASPTGGLSSELKCYCVEHALRLDWVFFGDGPMHRSARSQLMLEQASKEPDEIPAQDISELSLADLHFIFRNLEAIVDLNTGRESATDVLLNIAAHCERVFYQKKLETPEDALLMFVTHDDGDASTASAYGVDLYTRVKDHLPDNIGPIRASIARDASELIKDL